MNRRDFLAAAAAASAFIAAPLRALAPASRTRWKVRASEGFDAICFLAPLSGGELYAERYKAEVAAFAPKLPAPILSDIIALWKEGAKPVGLFSPFLTVIFSGGNDPNLERLIEAAGDPENILRPQYAASDNWDPEAWSWFASIAPRVKRIFEAMRDAGFASYRRSVIGTAETLRPAEVTAALAPYDVISWQEKLTGRTFDPTIEIVLLHFSKPHGIKVRGQTFLQALDYPLEVTVRNAAHEMLHPPIDMEGPAAKAAMAVLERDALIMKIVKEHDPSFGYTTLEGYLNEDLVEALDQVISDRLGVARPPATRWHKADGGMHVLAAGLYGLLMEDKWGDTGGDIEQWVATAARTGRLAPASLHPVAALILERPLDRLWPLPAPEPAA